MIDDSAKTILEPCSLPMDALRTLVAAVDTGSFTQAAELVHRTQSAVSMQVRRLERELGRELFVRQGRGVVATGAGETLCRYARRLLALNREAVAAVSGPGVRGRVRFGAPEDFAGQYLPRVLRRFASEHPGVEVDVHCDASPALKERAGRGGLDVVLTTEDYGTDAHGRDVHRIDLAWMVPEGGGALHESPLPLAMFHSGCLYRRNALDALERVGIACRVAYGSPSLAGVLSAVRAGLAVAPVSRACKAPGCRLATDTDGLPELNPVAIALGPAPEGCGEAVACFHGFMREELRLSVI